VDVSGGPHARGVSYGRQAAKEIRRGVDAYLSQIAAGGVDDALLDELVKAYLPLIANFDEGFIEEMRGIAEGAETPFSHIVLLNARTELLKIAANPAIREALVAKDGCTTIVVQPERSRDGKLIHAHNWDWKATCADSCVILRVRPDDGPSFITFTEAGALARFGFNSAGLAITGNYLECERDYRRAGAPLALIRRKVLQEANPSLAFKAIYTAPKSGSNNLTLSHAPSGVVHDLECAPDETFVVEPERGLLVHANHWQSPVAQTKLRETGVPDSPDSFWREQRARRLLGDRPLYTPEDIVEVLSDQAGAPWSICFGPRASSMTGESATVATIVMRPSEREMRVAMLPALGGAFTSYTLDEARALEDA
jgi:isopenicillin-N N-acyltransferase-like protein